MSIPQAGPTALHERALGPDLARGAMLLFIALANTHYFLAGESVLGGYPQDTGTLDRAVTWAVSTFVDGRAYPMFGLLFGYGVAHVVARQPGPPAVTRRLLWRRALVLVGLGVTDAFLLFVGDILAAYGVLLLLGAWAVRWPDRWLLRVAVFFFVLTALPSADSMSISDDPPDAAMLPTDLLAQLADRPVAVAFVAFLGPFGFAGPFLLGLWAGRRRVLEQPGRHLRLLRTTAAVGVSAAVLGAQPVALVLARVLDRPSAEALTYLGPLHDTTGVLGGFGYAALAALLARRLDVRHPVVRALAATGQRSLTCYLMQSVAWSLLFTPYLLGLADDLSVAATALIAAAVWALTVLAADRMRAAGERGPFEQLLRRATYGSPTG